MNETKTNTNDVNWTFKTLKQNKDFASKQNKKQKKTKNPKTILNIQI